MFCFLTLCLYYPPPGSGGIGDVWARRTVSGLIPPEIIHTRNLCDSNMSLPGLHYNGGFKGPCLGVVPDY